MPEAQEASGGGGTRHRFLRVTAGARAADGNPWRPQGGGPGRGRAPGNRGGPAALTGTFGQIPDVDEHVDWKVKGRG